MGFFDDLMGLAVMGLVFLVVVLLVLAVAPMFEKRVNLRERLALSPSSAAPQQQQQNQSLRTDQTSSLWGRLVTEVERRGLSLTDSKGDALAMRLMLAGHTQPWAPRAFVLARTVLTLALPAIALIVALAIGAELTPVKLYALLVGTAAVGLYLPNFIIGSQADTRKTKILNGFPDTLDLMLVCVEAGLGIDACFNRVGQEITELHPELAELFAAASLELRAGRSRAEALKNMAKRSGVTEIGSFVTLVVQADKLGSSIGQALKIYAAEMREVRKMRAEEKAHRLPVLLSVPLVAFLLPSMLSVLMLPAAISMRNSFAEVGSE